jgi:hypothetical protein
LLQVELRVQSLKKLACVCCLRRAWIESEWNAFARQVTMPFYRAKGIVSNPWFTGGLHYILR